MLLSIMWSGFLGINVGLIKICYNFIKKIVFINIHYKTTNHYIYKIIVKLHFIVQNNFLNKKKRKNTEKRNL